MLSFDPEIQIRKQVHCRFCARDSSRTPFGDEEHDDDEFGDRNTVTSSVRVARDRHRYWSLLVLDPSDPQFFNIVRRKYRVDPCEMFFSL